MCSDSYRSMTEALQEFLTVWEEKWTLQFLFRSETSEHSFPSRHKVQKQGVICPERQNRLPLSLLVLVRSLQEQFHNHSACWSSVKSKLRSFRAFSLLCCSSRLCCVLFSDCKMNVSSCVSCDDGVIFPRRLCCAGYSETL